MGKAGILPPVDLASLPKKKSKGEAEAEKVSEEVKPGEKAEVAAPAPSEPAAAKEEEQK